MPILRGSVSFSRYRVEAEERDPREWKKVLSKGLKGRAFEPIDMDGAEERAGGWAELEDSDRTEFDGQSFLYGEYALFTWRLDQLRIPASAVRAEMERWRKAFEKENQRPPGRREREEAKAGIRQTLRARTIATTKTFDVSWNLQTSMLQIWAGSRKIADELQAAVEQTFEVTLVPLVAPLVAEAIGVAEGSLGPTPALSMPEA